MMSVFPELFDFSLIAVFVLRATAGIFFWVFGIRLIKVALRIKSKDVFLKSIGIVYGLLKSATGILLVVGVYTQVMAILGMMLSLLSYIQEPKNTSNRQVQILLFVLCFSLLFLGPGTFAVDLPL